MNTQIATNLGIILAKLESQYWKQVTRECSAQLFDFGQTQTLGDIIDDIKDQLDEQTGF